ncbi:MAG: heme-binding protein, partial [Leucobacter sp.]|nr:heme-binding protein [Leucobacter sp.]
MTHHFSLSVINLKTATRAIELAIEIGERHGVKVASAVVDPALELVAYARADGITPHSVETSQRKATTAASTRRPSALVPEHLATPLEHGTGGLLTSIPGGVPIVFNGVHIGGLGGAGGPPPGDATIALEVLEALGADPV